MNARHVIAASLISVGVHDLVAPTTWASWYTSQSDGAGTFHGTTTQIPAWMLLATGAALLCWPRRT